MAYPIADFEFKRNWTNPSDFPTYERDEGVVRADMQALYDEIKLWLNDTLIPAVRLIGGKEYVTGMIVGENGHIVLQVSNGTEIEIPRMVTGATYEKETDTFITTFSDGSNVAIPAFREVLKIHDNLSELTEDKTHRVITDDERVKWDKASDTADAADALAKGAMPTTGGTFSGVVKAGAETPAESLLRNSRLLEKKSYGDNKPLADGQIDWLYE